MFSDYIGLQERGILNNLKLGRIEKESKEREADLFAAYFLIPDEKLKLILKEEWIKKSPNPIPKLAKEFQVPEELMRRRLEEEGVNSKNFNSLLNIPTIQKRSRYKFYIKKKGNIICSQKEFGS